MINLTKEKECALSAKDRHDILSFSIETADANGFLNSFVFERAMYCYAALMLAPDDETKDNIRAKIVVDLISGWDGLVADGTVQEMLENYKEAIDQLAEEGWTWFEEYNTYATSARNIINLVEQFSDNIVENAAAALTNTMEESGAGNVLEIADKWGMNNRMDVPREPKDYEISDEESLFE